MGKKRGKKGIQVQTTHPPPESTTVVPNVPVTDDNSAETHVQHAIEFESEVLVSSDTGANVQSVEEDPTTIYAEHEGSNFGIKSVQEQFPKETDAAISDVPHSEAIPFEDSLQETVNKQKDETQTSLVQESKEDTVSQKQDQMQNEKKTTGKRGKKKGERKDETEKEEHKQPEMTPIAKDNDDGEIDLSAMNKGGKQEKQKKSNKKRDKKKSEISESEEESYLQEILVAEETTITSSTSKEMISESEEFQMRTEEMHIHENTTVLVERQPVQTEEMKEAKQDGVTEIVQEKAQDEFSEEDDTAWCQVTRKGGKKKDKKKGDKKNYSGLQTKDIPEQEEVTQADEQLPTAEAIKVQQLNLEKDKKGRNRKNGEIKAGSDTPPKEDLLKEQDNVVLSSIELKIKDSLTDVDNFAPVAAEPGEEPEIPPVLNVVSATKTLPTSPSETIQVPDIIDALIEVYGNEAKPSTPDSAMSNQEPETQLAPETITTADTQSTLPSSKELFAFMKPNLTPLTESASLAAEGPTIDPLIESAISPPSEFSVPASKKSTSPPPKEAPDFISAEPVILAPTEPVMSPPSKSIVSTSTEVTKPLLPEPTAIALTEPIMLQSPESTVPVSTESIATTETTATESILLESAVLSQVMEPSLPISKEPIVSQLIEPLAPQPAETILPFTVESIIFAPAGTTVTQSTESNVPSTIESSLPTNAKPLVSLPTEPTELSSKGPIAWLPTEPNAPLTTKFNLLTSAETDLSQSIEPALMTEAASGLIQPTTNLRNISLSTQQISSEPQVEDMSEGEAMPTVLTFENLELEDDFEIPDLIEEDMESQFSPIDLTQEEEMFRLEEAKQQFESAQELLKGLEIFPPETGVPTEGKIQVQPISALGPETELDLKLTQNTESQIQSQITKAKFVPIEPIDPFMEDEVIIDTGIPTENILGILPEPEINTEHMQMTTEPLAETTDYISSPPFIVAGDRNKVASSEKVPIEEEQRLLEAVRLPVDINELNDSAEAAADAFLEVGEPQLELSKKKKKKDNKKGKKSEYTSTKEKKDKMEFSMETSDQQQNVELEAVSVPETLKLASEPTEKEWVAVTTKDEEKSPIKPVVETVAGSQEKFQNQVEVGMKAGQDKLMLDTMHDEAMLLSKPSLEAYVESHTEPIKHMKSDETDQLRMDNKKSKKKERNKFERKRNFDEITEIITEPEESAQIILEEKAPADKDEELKKLTADKTSFESVIEAAAVLTAEVNKKAVDENLLCTDKEQSDSQKNKKYKKEDGKQRKRKPEDMKERSEAGKSKCEELLENTDINPTPMGEYKKSNVPTDEVLEKMGTSKDDPILADDMNIKQVEQCMIEKEHKWGIKKGKQNKEEKAEQEEEGKNDIFSHDSKCEELLKVINVIPATLGACSEQIVPTDEVLQSTEISSEEKLSITYAIDTTQEREGKDKKCDKKKGKQSKEERAKQQEWKTDRQSTDSKCKELPEVTDIMPDTLGDLSIDEVLQGTEISSDDKLTTTSATDSTQQEEVKKEKKWGKKKGKQNIEEKSKQEEEKTEKKSYDTKCKELTEVSDVIPAPLKGLSTDDVLQSMEISSEGKSPITSAVDYIQEGVKKEKKWGKKQGKQGKDVKSKQEEERETEKQSHESKCEELPEVTEIMPATLKGLPTDDVLQSIEISSEDKHTITSPVDYIQEGVKKGKKWGKKQGKQGKDVKTKQEEERETEKQSHESKCEELPEVTEIMPATLEGLPPDEMLQCLEISSESKPTITSAKDSIQGVTEGKKWDKKQGKQSKEVKLKEEEEGENEKETHDSKCEKLPEVTDIMPATLGELPTDEVLQSKEITTQDKPTITGATHTKEAEAVEKGKKWGKKKGKQCREEKCKQEEEQNIERQTHDSKGEELPEVIDVMPSTTGELPTDGELKRMETSQDKSTLKSAVNIGQEEAVVEKGKKGGKKKGKQSKEDKEKHEAKIKSEEKLEKSSCEELPVNIHLVPSPLGENTDNVVPSEISQVTESSTQERPILTGVSNIDQEEKLVEKKGSKKKGRGKQGGKEGKGKPEVMLNEAVLKGVTPNEVPGTNESTSSTPKVTEIPDIVADTSSEHDIFPASAIGLQEEKSVGKVEKEEKLNQKKGKGKGGNKDKKPRTDQMENKSDEKKFEEVSTSSEVKFAAGISAQETPRMQGELKQIAQGEGKSIINKEAEKETPNKEKGKQGGKKGKKGKSEANEVSQKVKESVSKPTEKSVAAISEAENSEEKKTEAKSMTLSELFVEVLQKKVRGKLHITGDSTIAADYADMKKQEEMKEDKMKEKNKKMEDTETRGMKQKIDAMLEKNENLQETDEEDKQVTVKAEEDKVSSTDIKLASEDDDFQLTARPVFIANACHICKVLNENGNKLKSCGACKMIAYCGLEHQKQHWQQHKTVCAWVRKQLAKEKKEHLFSEVDGSDYEKWKNVRYKYMTMCEKGIERKLELYEREMFLFPRVCETCHSSDQDTLKLCEKCHSVNYCSPEHLSKDHSKWCKELRLLLDINTYQSKYGMVDPPLPDKIFETYEELPPTMKEFLVTKVLGPSRSIGLDKVIFICLTEIASYPLTVLYAMQHISRSAEEKKETGKGEKKKGKKEVEKIEDFKGLDKYESLTIHLVGAEIQFEGDAIAKWDVFILNVIPNLQSLRIVLIGPELSCDTIAAGVSKEDFRCPHCATANREFICEFQPNMTYHEYVKSPAYTKPDIIAAFNSGLYRHTGFDSKDSWGPSIPYLIKDPTVPLILTAYTSQESPKDIARIKKQGKIEILLPSQRNPYRSLRPNQTFLEDESPVMYRNNFVAVIRGTK